MCLSSLSILSLNLSQLEMFSFYIALIFNLELFLSFLDLFLFLSVFLSLRIFFSNSLSDSNSFLQNALANNGHLSFGGNDDNDDSNDSNDHDDSDDCDDSNGDSDATVETISFET